MRWSSLKSTNTHALGHLHIASNTNNTAASVSVCIGKHLTVATATKCYSQNNKKINKKNNKKTGKKGQSKLPKGRKQTKNNEHFVSPLVL